MYPKSHSNKVNPLFGCLFDWETETHKCVIRIQLWVGVGMRGRLGIVLRGARRGSGVWT